MVVLKFFGLRVHFRSNRRIPGKLMVVGCGSRHLDMRFARSLPWEDYLHRPFHGKRTLDGWKFSYDVPGFHFRTSYHHQKQELR